METQKLQYPKTDMFFQPTTAATKTEKNGLATIAFGKPPPPRLPSTNNSNNNNGKRPKAIKAMGRSDSSWITNPATNAKEVHQRTKKLVAMKAMTKAFVESMRCSLEEAESMTSTEDRIDCIHFGNLLVALELMNDCMKTYGMKRTTTDLEHHCSNARMLHRSMAPNSRDYLSCLLQQPSELNKNNNSNNNDSNHESTNRKNTNNGINNFNKPFVRAFSIAGSVLSQQLEEESPKLTPHDPRVKSCVASIESHPTRTNVPEAADPSAAGTEQQQQQQQQSTAFATKHDSKKDKGSSFPCLIDVFDREKARNSMFWLCYFVRYTYNVHRLVVQIGHDPFDASPMAFMRYLHPYFGDYYAEKENAKAYLKLLADYQREHFFGTSSTSTSSGGDTVTNNSGLDLQAMKELKAFLGVLEVVMYLWTPAFQDMALQGGEFLSR